MPLKLWVADYVRRRYGPATPESALQAWALLLASVYNATDCHTDHSRDIPTSRPGICKPRAQHGICCTGEASAMSGHRCDCHPCFLFEYHSGAPLPATQAIFAPLHT